MQLLMGEHLQVSTHNVSNRTLLIVYYYYLLIVIYYLITLSNR
jgi:hypothetical protein